MIARQAPYYLSHSASSLLWLILVRWRLCHVREAAYIFFFGCVTGVWTQGFSFAKQACYCLSHASSSFFSACFGDGVLGTLCLAWPLTSSLLIPAFQVARIKGMSHQCLAGSLLFKVSFSASPAHSFCWILWYKDYNLHCNQNWDKRKVLLPEAGK
jgi:hypothetical protein